MTDTTKVFLVFLVIVVWLGFRAAPTPRLDKQLRDVFVSAEDKDGARDIARRLSDVILGLATNLETDGKQSEPFIKSCRQLEEVRKRWILKYENGTFDAKLPGLNKAMGRYLDARAGDDPGELTQAKRAAWVKAFQDLSQELKMISRSF